MMRGMESLAASRYVGAVDPVLVLWDLDWTLLETGGLDQEIWFQVCADLLRLPVVESEVVPGSTAPQLLRGILIQRGATAAQADRLLPEALRLELNYLTSRSAELARRGRALPGAMAALSALALEPHILQSVLTGNQRTGGEIKLSAFGLLASVDLDIGSFGSDSAQRHELVDIARRKAEAKHGRTLL